NFRVKAIKHVLAIEKLSTLHNAYMLEARLVISIFLYFMTIIILHMLTSTRQTYSIRSRLYLEVGVTLLIKIVVYRDYDSLNHQMLQTLVDKVNKLRNKNDNDGYNDDVDWSSWIDSDITEYELDDLEYVPPKGRIVNPRATSGVRVVAMILAFAFYCWYPMGSCVSFTKDGVIRLAAIRLDSIFLKNDAYRRRTKTLVNEDKSSGELVVNKLYNVDKKAEQLLDSSNHIDRSVSSINIQTQELAQTSKNVQERVNDVLDQSLKTSDSQMELQNSQTKMNGRLDKKEIVQAMEEVLKRMDGLQNKADDIKNKQDKQKQLVRSQTIALEVLQNAQEENR
nr:hypothetical protein [Tanacetum cinerariifolium]